jgi:hypothetical protein
MWLWLYGRKKLDHVGEVKWVRCKTLSVLTFLISTAAAVTGARVSARSIRRTRSMTRNTEKPLTSSSRQRFHEPARIPSFLSHRRKLMIGRNEVDANDYLRALLEKPEFKNMDEVRMRAEKYIKTDHLKNYFINKATEFLKT